MQNVYNCAEAAVRSAGRLLLDRELYKGNTQKAGDANYVTEVDLAVQEILAGELEKILPGSNIITEESAVNFYDLSRPTWILDPVDGTTNLMHQFRHSCISLALMLEGRGALGIVFNPYMNEMFVAAGGQGAVLNGEPFKVSGVPALAGGLIGFGTTPYDRSRSDETFTLVSRVFQKSQEVRRSGSAALDIAYVACGRLDGFFELMLQPWDFAAGAIILEEAGGRITDWHGKPLDMLKPSGVIAANADVFDELFSVLVHNNEAAGVSSLVETH